MYNIQVIYFSTAMKKADFMLKWVTVKNIGLYLSRQTNDFLFVSTLDADRYTGDCFHCKAKINNLYHMIYFIFF